MVRESTGCGRGGQRSRAAWTVAAALLVGACGGTTTEDGGEGAGAAPSGGTLGNGVAPGSGGRSGGTGGAGVGGAGVGGTGDVAGAGLEGTGDVSGRMDGEERCPELVGLGDCGWLTASPDPRAPCFVPVPGPPADIDSMNVAIDCQVVTKSADDADGSSFRFTDDYLSIVMGGVACEALETGEVTQIDVVFGCGTGW